MEKGRDSRAGRTRGGSKEPRTQLVWELLAEDGHGGADPLEHGHGEGGADGQPVDEVVEAVAEGDHPGQRPDVRVPHLLQPVARALGGLQVLPQHPKTGGQHPDGVTDPSSRREIHPRYSTHTAELFVPTTHREFGVQNSF